MNKTVNNSFQTLLILCISVTCLYQFQEAVLRRQSDIRRGFYSPPFEENDPDEIKSIFGQNQHEEDIKILSASSSTRPSVSFEENESSSNTSSQNSKKKIWISMGLCWTANSEYHAKSNFDYKTAAFLSTRLWLNRTDASPVIQIVFDTKVDEKSLVEPPPADLVEYKSKLEAYGVLVKLVPNDESEMKCVLKSQLIRMVAFELDEIEDDEIVVTADVDAFIIDPIVTFPLKKLNHKKVWVYRYELSLLQGYTFMMNFIAMKAETWRTMLGDNYRGSLPKMVENYSKLMKIDKGYTWDIDQKILSYGLLENELCTLPEGNKLWEIVNVKYRKFDDKGTCWHGGGVFEDCNNKLWERNLLIRYHGNSCKWWHFYPDETKLDMEVKFEEISNDLVENKMVNSVLKTGKSLYNSMYTKVFGSE